MNCSNHINRYCVILILSSPFVHWLLALYTRDWTNYAQQIAFTTQLWWHVLTELEFHGRNNFGMGHCGVQDTTCVSLKDHELEMQ